MEENHITSMPRIGDKAPEFKAVTTQGPTISRQIIPKAGLSYSVTLLISHRYVLLNL